MIRSHRLLLPPAIMLSISLPLLAFKVPIHLEITKTVLGGISKTVGSQTYKFTDKAIQEVMKANQDTDQCISCQLHSEYHFDDQNFAGGSQRLVDLKNQILSDLSGSSPNGPKAREHLGQALHTLQDFYAHSTRVELGQSSYDSMVGVSMFNGPGTVQTCPSDPAVLGGAGLSSVTSGYFPLPQPCTSSIPTGKCRHGNDESLGGILSTCNGINKDAPSRPNYQAAHDLAVTATNRFVTDLILNDTSITNNAKAVKALMGIANTLGMVVDTTGSMGDVIGSVQSNIGSIVNSVVGTPDEPNEYLLEPFNDPFWGPPTLTADAPTYLAQVNSLFASGGGDCPELAMDGLLEAVNTADDDSTLYLFTDASAKDSGLYPSVNAVAGNKNINVNFILFGSCSPIDPGFQAVAAATGGQVFLLNRATETGSIFPLVRSQVGPPQVTLTHVAGTISGSRDVQFPVDSSATLLSISISLDTVSSITVKRPDGSVVTASDPGVTLTGLSTGAIYLITSPQSGTWDVNLQGSGAYSADVRGKTTRDLLSQFPNFSSFDFVTLTGRVAHEGYFPIPGQPVVGGAQTVVARVSGTTSNVAFSAVTEAGDLLQTLTLAQGDPNAAPDDFVGTVALPAQPFRLVATGKDASGVAFQRTIPTLFRPASVKVTPTNQLDGLPQGQSVSLTYTVQNLGTAGTFSLTGRDGKSFVTSFTPTSLSLAASGSGNVTVTLLAPQSAAIGTVDSITLIATSTTNSNVTNSSVSTLEVISGDTTPPTITAAANPSSLWPPNGKMITVTVSGTVTDSQSGVNLGSGIFAVTDEYGSVQPSGVFNVNSDGTYSFSISLEASRNGNDKDGRQYTIAVSAKDQAGNVGSASAGVVVPHDQGH